MRLLIPLAALLAAGISIWPDIHAVALDSRLCEAGLCRFDQVFTRIDAQGMDLENVASLIQHDPMNPFAWSVYADLLAAHGQIDPAAQMFAHAIELGPNMAPVLMRAANFDFAYGRIDHGMRMAHEILTRTDAFDQILFADLMHSGVAVSDLPGRAVPPTARAARVWLGWLCAHGAEQDLLDTWSWIRQNKLADQKSAVDLTRALWERKSFRSAQEVWAEWLGPAQDHNPNPQRLANTRFENEPSGSPLDWTLTAPPSVQFVRQDGLDIRFSGTENVAFSHVRQFATVEARSYRLSIEASASGLSTDERPYFRVFDPVHPSRLDVATAQFAEQLPRSWLTLDFIVPQGTEVVQVQLERRPSRRFDSKISGTIHVYRVSLVGSGKRSASKFRPIGLISPR